MAFPLAENKGGGELAPAGTFIARCFRLVDLGTQYSEKYKKSSRKVIIGWELPTELMADGRPFAINKWFTNSWHEKSNLRQMLQAWRGRSFDGDDRTAYQLTKIAGKCCLLNIIHEEKESDTKAKVQSVMALPKGTELPPAVNPVFIFSLNDFDQAAFDSLHESTQETIKASLEYETLFGQTAPPPAPSGLDSIPDDDIPWD